MLIREFIQILRDPRMKAVIFVTPVLQRIVFGDAVTTESAGCHRGGRPRPAPGDARC